MKHTTKRFARSLIEAFPADHAAAVEIHRRPLLSKLADWSVAVGIGVVLAAVLFYHL